MVRRRLDSGHWWATPVHAKGVHLDCTGFRPRHLGSDPDILIQQRRTGDGVVRANLLRSLQILGGRPSDIRESASRSTARRLIFLAALLAPQMISRGWGRIVNNTTGLRHHAEIRGHE